MTGHFLSTSSSFSLTGRSLPPTLSPRILPSLSNEVALHRPEIANSVSVALPIAITGVEEWLRGKAPGGSTVTCRSRTALHNLEILQAVEVRTDQCQSVKMPEMVAVIKVCYSGNPENQREASVPPEHLSR